MNKCMKEQERVFISVENGVDKGSTLLCRWGTLLACCYHSRLAMTCCQLAAAGRRRAAAGQRLALGGQGWLLLLDTTSVAMVVARVGGGSCKAGCFPAAVKDDGMKASLRP